MKGMIVAPQPLAVEEGAKVLTAGGNAVDAAVVTALTQTVVDPQMCGIGGFGSMHVYFPGRETDEFIDFHGRAGSKVTPGVWEDIIVEEARDGYGYLLKGCVNEAGYKSITVPGTVAGLHDALTRYGTISWKDALQPAIAYARDGFPLHPDTVNFWIQKGTIGTGGLSGRDRISMSPASKAIYLKLDGSMYDAGDRFVQKDMARTLERLAEEGPDLYYRGDVARRIAEDMEENGGFVRYEDLASYRVRHSEPVVGTYRGYTVASSPSPGGGLTVIQILKILEGYDLSALVHNSPEYINLVSLAMKAAYADRANLVGDPDFVDVPTADLVSGERADRWRGIMDSGEHFAVPRWAPPDTEHTTQVTAVDRHGNAVSLTHSLGLGSGVVTPGLGFWYNNCMGCFNPVPGQVNSIEPGKARVAGLSPTIVFKDGLPFLVLGAPGGTRIITGVLQVILNVIDHRMSILEAVSAPRFDCQGEIVDMEARIPARVRDVVKTMGHRVERNPYSYGSFGRVHAILVDREAGRLRGAADPRVGGMALSE